MAARMDSGKRKWKIKATTERKASYDPPIDWPLTAADVVAGGAENYRENVRCWAESIHTAPQKA